MKRMKTQNEKIPKSTRVGEGKPRSEQNKQEGFGNRLNNESKTLIKKFENSKTKDDLVRHKLKQSRSHSRTLITKRLSEKYQVREISTKAK